MLLGKYRDLESLVQLLKLWSGFFSIAAKHFYVSFFSSFLKFFFGILKAVQQRRCILSIFLHSKALFCAIRSRLSSAVRWKFVPF